MPGTFKDSEGRESNIMGPPVAPKSKNPNVTLQSWQQAQKMDLLHEDISAYGNHVRCGSVDSVDSGSSVSSSSSSGSNCRQLSNEGEFISTRTTTKTTPAAASHNPLQFVKVQSQLFRKAESQIKLVKEVKISKDTLKESEEEWQSNLDNWKSRRRKVSEKVIQRAEEMRQVEAEEELRQLKQKEQQRKIKTFSQIVEKRTSKRSYNLDLYIGQGDDSGIGDTPEPDEHEGALDSQHLHMRSDTSEGMTSETDSIDSDAHSSDKMTKEPPRIPKKPHSWLSRKDSDELAHRTSSSPSDLYQRCLSKTDHHPASESVSSAEPSDIEGHGADIETVSSEDDMGFCRGTSGQVDSGLDSLGDSHRPNDSADSASDLSQDSCTGIDKIGHDLETDLPTRFSEVESKRKRRPLLKSVSLQDEDYLENVDAQNLKFKMVLKQGIDTKGFGFSVKGGKDHGYDCAVENVVPGSVADFAGLKKGDKVVNMNGESTATESHASLVFSIKQATRSGELEVLIRRSNHQDPMTPEPKKTSRRAASFAEKLALFSGRSSSTTSFNSLISSKVSSEDDNKEAESLVLRRRSAFERSKAEMEEIKNRRSSCASPENTKIDERRLSVDLTSTKDKSPDGFPKKPPPPVPAKPKLKTIADNHSSNLKSDINFEEDVFSEQSPPPIDSRPENEVCPYEKPRIAKADRRALMHLHSHTTHIDDDDDMFDTLNVSSPTETPKQTIDGLDCTLSSQEPVDNCVNIVEEMTERLDNMDMKQSEHMTNEELVCEDHSLERTLKQDDGSNSSSDSSSPTEGEFDLAETRKITDNESEYLTEELPIDSCQNTQEEEDSGGEQFRQIHPLGLPLEKIDEDDGGISASTTTSSDTPDTETVIDNFPTTLSPLPNDDAVVDISLPQKMPFLTEKIESPSFMPPLVENLAVIAEENSFDEQDDVLYPNGVPEGNIIKKNSVDENEAIHSNDAPEDDAGYSNKVQDDDALYSNNIQEDDAVYLDDVQEDVVYSNNVQEDAVYSNGVQDEDVICSNGAQEEDDVVYSNDLQEGDAVYRNSEQDEQEMYLTTVQEKYLTTVQENDTVYRNNVEDNELIYSGAVEDQNDDQYELDESVDQLSPLDVIDQIEMKLMQQLEQEMIEDLTDDTNGQLEDEVNRQLLYLSDDADLLDDFDAPRNMLPPSEPPPPPPPEPESGEKANPFQRINSTKRIKKELWRRRSDFLGLDSPQAISVDDLPPPPPGLEELLKSEMEQQREQRLFLEKQLSLNEAEYSSIVSETSISAQYSYNEEYNSDYLMDVLDAEVYDAVADDPEPEDWKTEDECQIPESELTVIENNLENVERDNRLNGGSQNKAKTHIQSLGAAPKAKIMDSNKWITQTEKHGALMKQKSVDPVLSGGSYNQNFWLAQEAEQRNTTEDRAHVPVDRRYSMPPAYSNNSSSSSNRQPNVTLRTWNDREAQPPLRPKSAIWQERSASVAHPSSSSASFTNAISSQRSSYAESSSISGDEQPSLEVSHQCSYCGSALTEGSAMGIDALQLYFHIECFRCSACHLQLGNGSCGTDVQVKNNHLYCPKCFLLD